MKKQTHNPAPFVIIIFLLFSSLNGYSQYATLGLSAGGGIGFIKENFTENGSGTPLSFTAPGPYFSAELLWDNVYFDMSLGLLLTPGVISLGEQSVDISNYPTKLGIDFNAFGIGYLHPFNDKISAGGALGFHVSSLMFTPEDEEDESLLRFGGYYGLIGLDLVPRIRYSISDSFKITVSIPLGCDFGPMSDEVVVGGTIVGEVPAIVQPASLVPNFNGLSMGLYITAGYYFQLNR